MTTQRKPRETLVLIAVVCLLAPSALCQPESPCTHGTIGAAYNFLVSGGRIPSAAAWVDLRL